MTGVATTSRPLRSMQSLRFEQAVRAPAPGMMPHLTDVDYSELRDLVPWIAVIDPDKAGMTLKFTRVGAGIGALIGPEAVGFDYLSLVDPAIKGEAFDSCFLMLARPCGLWQITPAVMADGSHVRVEYTGFPVFDAERGRGQIIFLISPALDDVGRSPPVAGVQHAATWQWLELKTR